MCRTDSARSSLESSASSLRRRLQELPPTSEAIKLADRVAALDRRIRRERHVNLHFQGLVDRIEEKDEPEVVSKIVVDPRARRRANMCSSAPETMRLNKDPFEQSLSSGVATSAKNALSKKFDVRRPPKYLEPLDVPVKEILRSNAPALCISESKFAELLRRGSISAREEYLKKSTGSTVKFAAPRRPTGMIIKNLSSGSDEDCTSHWLIRGGSSVPKFKPEASILDSSSFRFDGLAVKDGSSIPNDTRNDRPIIDIEREESGSRDHPRSSMISTTAQKSAHNGKVRAKEDKELSEDRPSAEGAGRSTRTSIQNSMAKLKSVLTELESNSRNSDHFIVPKLEIQSREYSQSASIASREDPSKRSLDMNALFRALSDVSIKQQDVAGRRVVPGLCESIVSRSTGPMSSAHTSVADGSRQSMSSAENVESREPDTDFIMFESRSPGSSVLAEKIEFTDPNLVNQSELPSSARSVNDTNVSKVYKKEARKIARGMTVAEDTPVLARERRSSRVDTRRNSSPSAKSPRYRSSHPVKIHSPETRKSQQPKSPRASMTDASSVRERSSAVAKNGFPSFDTLVENFVKHDGNKKLTNGPAAVSSEPGTSRNDRRILRDRLSSRGTSGARDILQRVLRDDSGSSDDRFKYLRRGSKLPYSRSSSGSPSSERAEDSESELKIIRPSATGFQSADRLKTKAQFKVYEDTDEAASPEPEAASPIDGDDSHSCKTFEANDEESGKSSSTESNRAKSCFLESRIKEANTAILPESRSCQISPGNGSTKRPNSSSEPLTGSSPKICSNTSPIGTGSGGSPPYRFGEDGRRVSENLAGGTLEDFEDKSGRQSGGGSIFSATSVVKRLSYSETKAPRSKEDTSDEEQSPFRDKRPPEEQPEVSSSDEEFVEDAGSNSSRTNLAAAERSESYPRRFGNALGRTKTGSKVSASLSKLTHSPEESNLAWRRRSQDRFPFTISESASAKSSSKLKVDDAIQEATSGCVIIEPSETAYKLRAHPSLLRLAGAGYEATAGEIIDGASRDPDIIVGHTNFVEKFVRKFSRRRRLRKQINRSVGETTKVLYENKECRVLSADESSGSNTVDKAGRRFNRDGLWVAGLRDKNLSDSEFPDTKEQDIIDRYTIFLAKRDQHRRQFGVPAVPLETPMISAADDDCDVEPGCFCAKICKFFIAGNIHYRNRSTLFLRARSSRVRRRFR